MSPRTSNRRRFTPRTIVVLTLLVVLLGGLLWDGSPLAAFALREAVDLKFRDIRHVSPSELITWMQDPNRPPPLLVDARPADEVAQSHIEGAVAIDPGSPDLAPLAHVSRETPIVVYDGPGVVAAVMARGLMDAGFTRVSNLEGGLFRWVNEGHPVVNAQGPASQVRTAGWAWSRLLKSRYRM
jgi:rhodanese-related sulfurtransferase